jgi:hypothetical protein
LSVPSERATRSTSAWVQAFPQASLAGSAGIKKNSTKLINVTAMKSTTAQRKRRTT